MNIIGVYFLSLFNISFDFIACPLKFQRAKSLYCDEDCGVNWLDNEYGCQGADADAFCRLKYCNSRLYARNFSVTSASNLSGFSCKGIGIRFEKKIIPLPKFGDIYYSNSIIKSHGEGFMVANVTCTNITRM